MPLRDKSGIGERVPRELINADFDVAFSLVEMAGVESRRHNAELASQLLRRAEGMLDEIQRRLVRLTPSQKEAFEARCLELAQAIERAKAPDSGIGPDQ